MTYTRRYMVTVRCSANMTDEPWKIHSILTSTDNIQPADRVEVVAVDATEEASPEASPETAARLEYLRGQIRGEDISWGEIAELQGLAAWIDPGDVELLEWAGVPEHGDD